MALTITRADLIRMVKDEYGDRGEAASLRIIIRAIENGLRELSRRYTWNFQTPGTCAVNPTAPTYIGSVAVLTATVAHGATSVTINAGVAPANCEGAFIEFNGETGWYEIVDGAGTATLTIERAYKNAAAGNLTAVDFKIMYPLVDLPANYRKRLKLYDVLRQNYIAAGVADALWYTRAHSGENDGQPVSYSVRPKRNDANVQQVLLYPAPDAVESYELSYVRHAGWFAGSDPLTAIWKMRSTADTDYIDWPESEFGLLETSILHQLYLITKDGAFASYEQAFQNMVDLAIEDNREDSETHEIGDDVGGEDWFEEVRIE